jgi:hypothetical protein
LALELERALDELYGADLDDFVPRRTELAKRLRGEGEREAAAEVARLRKPTVSAWTVNRLAREERRGVDLLLDAGRRLRDAHAALLGGGDPKELDRAGAAQRDALRGLAASARRLLEERRGSASEATIDRVTSTLRAASVDDAGRELLALGRLTEDADPSGFDALAGLAAAPRPGGTKPKPRRGGGQAEIERLRAELGEARALERELEQAARQAEREAERAHAEWERKRADADRARADASDAAEAAAAAKERFDRARS